MQVPASALGGVCGMCSSGPGGAGAVGEGGCFGTSFSLVAFLAQGCAGSGMAAWAGPALPSSAVSEGWAGLF